ncbi:lysophospholipid acyltransferase family protein [Halanaerobium sp. ST460_2HS_T2]|uniref:lysophospholipid acyltransferase family protein n=1 Tax=Halanaerobium sp. ST460_2HS_T2 TaxID=2183914 RepID=UPI000DF2C6A8|nr:hypothetical protein [Halanaerobium sp. ST460_2HS_T2]RCW52244.1 hypothetical protein DFR80_13216 [Halanaerobium sp. ST460_2HS_T2]
MQIFFELKEKIISFLLYYYIEFVYKTSKIEKIGRLDLLEDSCKDKFIIFIWHGDSYCYYPFLEGKKLNIITTKNKRGGVISRISSHFGYDVLRLPDTGGNGDYIFKVRDLINKKTYANLVMSVDGPTGPQHEIKNFALIMALFSKRKILPVTIEAKHKIELKKRWDKLKLPLPFNRIKIKVNDPFNPTKSDRKEKFITIKKEIKNVMESQIGDN